MEDKIREIHPWETYDAFILSYKQGIKKPLGAASARYSLRSTSAQTCRMPDELSFFFQTGKPRALPSITDLEFPFTTQKFDTELSLLHRNTRQAEKLPSPLPGKPFHPLSSSRHTLLIHLEFGKFGADLTVFIAFFFVGNLTEMHYLLATSRDSKRCICKRHKMFP